jgi:hypothetical protein
MSCPAHPLQKAVGQCEICSQEVCALCLKEAPTPLDFECLSCGNTGTIVLYETLRHQSRE